MKTAFDAESKRLRLDMESHEEAADFASAIRRESGFLVQLQTRLSLHQPITVAVRIEAPLGEFEARVAQVFDKGYGQFGTALLVDDAAAVETLVGVTNKTEGAHPDEAAPEGADPGGVSPDGAGPSTPDEAEAEELPESPDPVDEAAAGEMRGTSPIHRIKAMNPRQRSLLAMKAGRTERSILLRDNSPQVLQNLLNNPRIDAEEILQIARSSHVVAPVLQRIASDARWAGNQEIIGAIARHPKTPSVFATRLMPSLRTSDLRMMAKMQSGLKEMVRKAALREYMRRTGQRI